MSDSSEIPWSNNPYAPQIPRSLYFAEKASFAGAALGAIFYGIVIVMFFQSTGALLDPANRKRGGLVWGLVAHTVAMFSFVTIYTATNLDMLSISFIDNREFPGIVDAGIPPGPVGYQLYIIPGALNMVTNSMILLNTWLADGLLLYRCYIICSRSSLVIAFPFLMYLATVGMGIWFMYQTAHPTSIYSHAVGANIGVPYFSISISLNILLTILVIVRLVMRRGNIRNAMGGGGLYNAIVTILTESSALYAVSSILFIAPWGASSWVAVIFLPILVQVQVISPFLITLRVANQTALTSATIASGNSGSTQFSAQWGSTTGNIETIPDIDVHRDKV